MKILIVEDDPNLRGGLQDLLELEGYDVICAADATAGFKHYQQQSPDFCIFDIMLVEPDDGYQLCEKIREFDMDIPVLMLSARAEEIDRVLGFECGADDYLSKPFGPRELVARIKAIAKRSLKQNDSSLSCFTMGDLEIDPNALRAFREGAVIELTVRDVHILKLLFDRSGEAVHRDELFDVCWGREYMSNSRALDQYISSLRSKLDTKTNRIIKTVRSVGYRYDP